MPKSAKTKSSSSPSLKQATLSFSAAKRTASNAGKKVIQRTSSFTTPVTPVVVSDEIEVSSSSDDDVELIESNFSFDKKVSQPRVSKQVVRARDDTENSTPKDPGQRPELDLKDPKWTKAHAAAKSKRGKVKLIHAENQDKFHDILRVFDLSYEYGPCIGVTRLERWMRAEALGLTPPTEVRDILVSRQGAEDSYSLSVFHGEV